MTTLFSPVGTADPITLLGDGPLLHIVRHRKPDKVVLFLSPDMAVFQRQDNRYTRAIELLMEQTGDPMPDIQLIVSDIEEVYRFDRYIEVFESILIEQFEREDGIVLVNVSSGTAGMAQALVALGSFGRLNLELLQVLTPKRGINERSDRENPNKYDLETLWEWDCEIENEADCRIVSVTTPNFSERLLRENVITLVKDFEYEAACKLVCQMSSASEETKQLIKAAACRLNLDGNHAAKAFGGTEISYRSNDLLQEYLYVMEVRLKQGHWADFIRALSPALTELMKKKLEPCLAEKAYVLFKDGKASGKYNATAIDADPRLARALRSCHYENSTFITNDAYERLVREYCEDEHVKRSVSRLRYAERKCRNELAHTLKVSSKNALEALCDMKLEDIMNDLFMLHGLAKPGLYDRINQRIIDSI